MTTAKWRFVPLERVRLADLRPTHGTREEWIAEKVAQLPRLTYNRSCADPHMHVVARDGALYVTDGHHRIAALRRAGRSHVWARVLR